MTVQMVLVEMVLACKLLFANLTGKWLFTLREKEENSISIKNFGSKESN